MKLLSITAISAGLVLAAITLHGAQAQTTPAKMVNRDELRACMNSESDLAARRKGMEEQKIKNREETAAIRAETQELTDEQQRIGQNQGRLDRLERQVKTHNARVKVAQANAQSFNTDLEALNKSVIAHNDQCGGISFSKEDKEAILKERESAAK
jgi:chromosome segregation ATPase